MADQESLTETKASLERVAKFDTATLSRRDELGIALNFEEAVEPARRIIALFQRLPPEALSEFPEVTLKSLKEQADQFFQLLGTVLSFSASAVANPGTERDALVQQLRDQYPSIFKALLPYISYAIARTVDFNRLEEQGRAAVQSIDDRVSTLLSDIEGSKTQIQKTLEDVRNAAAEQGVTQQAVYFKGEADGHDIAAGKWLRWTLVSAGGLIAYCFFSLFFHNMPFLQAVDTYSAIQLGASKLLIFSVLAYLVLTCGKNFMAHTHNAIVNRHRQNGLLTFKTLVDAAATPQAQDIILSHAAASIFEPQETGYTKQQPQDSALSAASVVRSLTSPQAPN